MKKITLLFGLMIASISYAQQQQYNFDFEDTNPTGVVTNWFGFDNNPLREIVTNPDPDGVNTSATTKVMKLVVGPGNAFYAGVNNRWQDQAFGSWKIDKDVPSNLTITMDVNKNYVGTVGIQMITSTGGSAFQITNQNVGNTVVNQWQTLTWTLPAIPPGLENNLVAFVVFVDWTQGAPDRAPNSIIHIDNIKFNAQRLTSAPTCSDGIQNGSETGVDCGGTCAPCAGQEPLVRAPNPPARNAGDVVSIFSGAYTNVALDELPTGWSSLGAFSKPIIDGDETWKLTGLDFLGMVTNYANGVDLSSMQKMHIDYWTPSANGIEVKIVNTTIPKPNEAVVSLGTTVTGSWQQIDIDMTAFAALSDKSKITQLLIDNTGGTASTLFIDNFYFYKAALGTDNFETASVKMYPNPVKNTLTIDANSEIQRVSVYNVLGQEVLKASPKANSATLQTSELQKGVYMVKTEIDGKISISKVVKE